MRLVVVNHLSLDGVMQGPGRADEDTRGGFDRGGWAAERSDQMMQEEVGKRMGGGLVLGRRSYDDMLASWNERGGPFKEALNAMPKFVASRDAATALPWPNSTLLHGDVPARLAALKADGDESDLVMTGSGELIRSLIPTGLIDEYLLMIHPLLLGSGRRLFDGQSAELRLADAITNTTGVIIATYRPA